MTTELVWLTPRTEEIILHCARVSSSNQDNPDSGLLRYLIRNRHWSPFEMASACFEIRTSRAIAQQILRHRSFSFQEFSQRYASPGDALIYGGRYQGESNRQATEIPLLTTDALWWEDAQKRVAMFTRHTYDLAIDQGIARESARFVLPMSTETRLYMAGTIRSWIHYFDLRCDSHTQLEHRDLATEIRDRLALELPTIAEALEWRTDENG